MLLYDNRKRIRLLLQLQGSIYSRVGKPFAFVFFYSCFLNIYRRLYPWTMADLEHPFALQTFGTLVAFAVCFRTNIAWNRYWEACQEMTQMYSKWSDAYSQLRGFIDVSSREIEDGDERQKQERMLEYFKFEFSHYFSVLSACAAERLAHGDIRRIKSRHEEGAPWRDLIAPREAFRQHLVGRGLVPMRVVEIDQTGNPIEEMIDEDKQSSKGDYGRVTTVCSLNRKTKAMIGKQLSGTRGSANLEEVDLRCRGNERLLQGGLDHRIDSEKTPVTVIGGLSVDEIQMLRSTEQRVPLVLMWITDFVSAVEMKLVTPAPIMSRVYQELSNGMMGFSQAQKLADIPFPFIFAQLLALNIIFVAIAAPPIITIITGNSLVTPIIATVCVMAFWALNEIAKELENPWEMDANDIPIVDAHERFVEFLISSHGAGLPEDRLPQSTDQLFDRRTSHIPGHKNATNGVASGAMRMTTLEEENYARESMSVVVPNDAGPTVGTRIILPGQTGD